MLVFMVGVIVYKLLVYRPLASNPSTRARAQQIANITGAFVNLTIIMILSRVGTVSCTQAGTITFTSEVIRSHLVYRGYHTAARRCRFYFRVAKTIFYERAQRVKYSFYHKKIQFISSSLGYFYYRCESPSKTTMRKYSPRVPDVASFVRISRVVFFPLKHSFVYNNPICNLYFARSQNNQ